MIRVDMHVHTRYSIDSMFGVKALIKTCAETGIGCVAITDHETIEGALKVRDAAPPSLKVIVGQEIRTLDGELTGFFLKERVPPDLSAEETFRIIKAQGGLVSIPHPFSFFRREAIYLEKLHELYSQADIIECYNARNFLFFENKRAVKFAKERNLVMGAGSDAHHWSEIGNVYVEMKDFSTKEEFVRNLKEGKVILAPYSRRIGSFMIEAFTFLAWVKLVSFFKKKSI